MREPLYWSHINIILRLGCCLGVCPSFSVHRDCNEASMTQVPLSTNSFLGLANGPPPGFPSSGNGLWFNTIGTEWAYHYLPVGNGYLAAMMPGGTAQETTFLNIESLWSGGPFADPVWHSSLIFTLSLLIVL